MNKSSKQTASSSLFVGVFDLRDLDVGYVVKTCLGRDKLWKGLSF